MVTYIGRDAFIIATPLDLHKRVARFVSDSWVSCYTHGLNSTCWSDHLFGNCSVVMHKRYKLHDEYCPSLICSYNKLCGRPPQYASAPSKLTFYLLTLKVVLKSRAMRATSVPILVFLGLSVLDLGPMYATDRRQTDVRRASSRNAPYPTGGGIANGNDSKSTSLWTQVLCHISNWLNSDAGKSRTLLIISLTSRRLVLLLQSGNICVRVKTAVAAAAEQRWPVCRKHEMPSLCHSPALLAACWLLMLLLRIDARQCALKTWWCGVAQRSVRWLTTTVA